MLLASASSLATLYTSMGSYDRAQPMYERALEIVRTTSQLAQRGQPDRVHRRVAQLPPGLRRGHSAAQGRAAALRDLLESIMPTWPAGGRVGRGLRRQGDSCTPRTLCARAKLREAKQGATHPQTALMRNNLAVST